MLAGNQGRSAGATTRGEVAVPAGDAGDVLRGRGGGKRAEKGATAPKKLCKTIGGRITLKDLVIRDTIHWSMHISCGDLLSFVPFSPLRGRRCWVASEAFRENLSSSRREPWT